MAPKKKVPGTKWGTKWDAKKKVPGTKWDGAGIEVIANWGGEILGLLIEFAVASKVIFGEGSREGKLHSLIGRGPDGELILAGFAFGKSHETDRNPSGE